MEKLLPRKINTYDDFQNFVNDDNLIDGAYKIGVISWEASKVLKHAKETRHIFSGHPRSTEPSIIKVLGMIEDCIKYVLNEDFPIQIIDIDDYLTLLSTEDYDRNAMAVENAFGDLPDRYKKELGNRLFTEYIQPSCSTIFRSNIEFCAPILWRLIQKNDKYQIARRIDQEITKGNAHRTNYAFGFIEIVAGLQYLSLSAKKYRVKPLVDELSQNLDKWDVEDRCVNELQRYSGYIPEELLYDYVNALTQTYVGKIGGSAYFSRTDFYADGAALKIPKMFEKFDDAAVDAFIKSIRDNRTLRSRIEYPKKLRRLRILGNILIERISEHYHDRELLEFLTDETKEKEFFENI